METFTNNPLTDDTVHQLWLLARGDFDLVEEAVMSSLEEYVPKWYIPWGQHEWRINIEKAIKYIMERRKEIEDIQLPPDDTNDLNNG